MRALRKRSKGLRFGAAFVAGAALFGASCSLLLDFDGRAPRPDGGGGASTSASGAGGGGPDGSMPPPLVAAYDLATCSPTKAPLDPAACDYLDQACAGFADLSETYVPKGAAGALDAKAAILRAAMVAYEWSPEGGEAPEVRVVVRSAGADAGPLALAIHRVDAKTLAPIASTPITITADGAPPLEGEVVLGRSERRVALAFAATDPNDDQRKAWVLTAPIDAGDLAAASLPATIALRVAAKLKVGASFSPARVSLVDDVVPGKLFVAVDDAAGGAPAVTYADEAGPEQIAFATTLAFKNGMIGATSARLHPRITESIDDAGVHVARTNPGAIARAKGKNVLATALGASGFSSLRWLLVGGQADTFSSADPWYSAPASIPSPPGPGFDAEPVLTRFDVFSVGGRSYVGLRFCAFGHDGACTISALTDGGDGVIDPKTIGGCDAGAPLTLWPDGAPPDAKGLQPSGWAVCELTPVALGTGLVLWHRTAGAFGAAIEKGGARVWIARPGGATKQGVSYRLALATELDPGAPLADDGPLDATFVPTLGWIVTAARPDGSLWLRRVGCASLP